MKKLKSLLATLAMLLCTISASAEDFSVDGIYYKITDSEKLTVAVTYRGNYRNSYSDEYTGKVVIPETVTYESKTYAVTSIGESAFYSYGNENGITSVTLPNSILSIGEYAFQYCQGITSFTIPNSVVSIGYYAFEQCINLSSIDLGNNVTSIGSSAFSWCKSLESIVIPNGVSSIESTTFNMCTKLSSVTIPNSVTSIGGMAFYSCSSLASVSIPNSVTSIGQGAFNGTAWYNNQPDGVVYINKIAYTYKGTMPSNTSITLKDGTTIISEYAFYNCTNLTSIIIPNSVASIGEYAFSGSGLTSINIPNSIVSINNNTFYGCNSLLSVIIPDGVKYIGEYAFDSCANLESISIPSSVEVIDGNAFMGCAKLASLYISDITAWLKIDFKGLYSHPTRDCAIYSLTSLYLNDELVTELTIPNEITSIPNFALCGISSLASVVIPNTVSKIGSDAFSMSGLTSITIPNSITSIESYTFDCCSKLVSVTIPNSVKNIGLSAFYGCTSLESISIYANTPPTVESSFTSENYNIDILVPASAVETYRSTQPWSNFTSIKALPLEILEIKNSISTFCSNSDLDFTSISGLKAYIASGYNKNTGKVM